MSELKYNELIEEVIHEIIGEPGKIQPFAENLVNAYLQDIVGEVRLLIRSGNNKEEIEEYFQKELRSKILDRVVEVLQKSYEFKNSLYKKSYERLKAITGYGDLFAEIYEDEMYLNEIFVRLVEEEEGVAITSAKQLQKLTGITEIYGYWDEGKGDTIPYGDNKPTKEEAQEIALKQIEDTFIKAMSYRYSKALEDILEAGGKYSDLLQVKPSYFNLPESWSGCLPTDQYSSILWAIENAFLIGEPNTSVRPDLKVIAQEIEAPYSVLMDAHKICNKWKLQS